MHYYGGTDIGKKRSDNQDSFAITELTNGMVLFTVCDGMGGANGGKTASSTACEVFNAYLERSAKLNMNFTAPSLMIAGVISANREVYEASQKDSELEGMGTTLVSLLVATDKLYAVNVGDSRLYKIYRRGSQRCIEKITKDHSYVQYLIDIGRITPEEAKENPNRNVITRAVGTEADVESDIYQFNRFNDGEEYCFYLLCSDGLTNYLSEKKIADIVLDIRKDEESKVKCLINGANAHGGGDNITAILFNNERKASE